MKLLKIPASVRLSAEDHARASLVALVDRRSVSEIIAECVRRALPELEAELERPRLTPEMKRRLAAGEPVDAVLHAHTELSPSPREFAERSESIAKLKKNLSQH